MLRCGHIKQVVKMHFFSKKIFFSTPGLADFVCLLGLFVWSFLSISRIFHSFGDVTITGEGLQILTYTRHSLSSEGSSACLTYCQRGNPFQFHDLQGRVVILRCGHIHDMVKMNLLLYSWHRAHQLDYCDQRI